MARRRSKSRKRKNRGASASPGAPPATAEAQPAGAPTATAEAAGAAQPSAPQGTALRPWRGRVQDLLDHLRGWSREHYGPAVEAFLAHHFTGQDLGDQDLGEQDHPDGSEAIRPEDVDRAIEDFACAPGSAGGDRSILGVFAEQAPAPDGGELDPEDRTQVLRWERERRRGVFLIQHATRDRLTLWDPLEGAPLTLHLLRKLPEARVDLLKRGTVVTATYQPWMARLVAVGEVEYFADDRAVSLFREETVSSGAQWHEAPPPAPQPTARKLR